MKKFLIGVLFSGVLGLGSLFSWSCQTTTTGPTMVDARLTAIGTFPTYTSTPFSTNTPTPTATATRTVTSTPTP